MKDKEFRDRFFQLIEEEQLKALAHAKSASWRWFTFDAIATENPCILVYIILTAKANATFVSLYDGVNADGKLIATIETTANQSRPFSFHGHIWCKHGLYVDLDGDALGVLVCWHEVPKSLGG